MSPLKNDDWKTIFLLKWSLFQGPFVNFFGGIFFEDGRWVSRLKFPSKHLLPKVCLLKTPFKLTIEANNFGLDLHCHINFRFKNLSRKWCVCRATLEDVLFSPNHCGLMSFFDKINSYMFFVEVNVVSTVVSNFRLWHALCQGWRETFLANRRPAWCIKLTGKRSEDLSLPETRNQQCAHENEPS